MFGGASQAILAPTTEEEGQEGYVPALVGQACCAQFAVSRERVLKRPKEDYVEFRRWLLETERNNAKSGRVLEFLWHVVFGMGPV